MCAALKVYCSRNGYNDPPSFGLDEFGGCLTILTETVQSITHITPHITLPPKKC